MHEHGYVTIITAILLIGGLCQWFSWWARLPAILFLLVIGIVLGPVSGLFNPDALIGDALLPLVSLAVALILFEGGLTLRFSEIRGHGNVVRNLVTVGAIVTWLGTAYATHAILGLSYLFSLLFGAIVVVSGPTVIVPMLRTVRPKSNIANILRWEGILIDPLGAMLAVLLYDFIVVGGERLGANAVFFALAKIVSVGFVYGYLSGTLLGLILRHHLLPEYLRSVMTLALVFLCYTVSDISAGESGLLAVTVMGMVLGNNKENYIDDILGFKESLSVLLISSLFLILAARIELSQLYFILNWRVVAVLLVMMLVIRPLSVWVSALGSGLNIREKLLLSWINPRGIVAAAVASSLALKLEADGFAEALYLLPLTFFVIVVTVFLQGITAKRVATWLGVREPMPRGVLIVGGNIVGRSIAKALQNEKFKVLLSDDSWENTRDARMENLDIYFGNVLSEHAEEHMDMVGIGKLLALSGIEETDALSCQRFRAVFGKNNVYQLFPSKFNAIPLFETASRHFGQRLFGKGVMFGHVYEWLRDGAEIRSTSLGKEFTYDQYMEKHHGKVMVLFAIDSNRNLRPNVNGSSLNATEGWTLIGLFKKEHPEEIENKAA